MKEKSKEKILIELEKLRKKSELEKAQLKAANQQLQATEQQLRASNQQLQASEQQLKATNQQLLASNQQLNLKNIVFEASIAANSIADNNGVINHVNPAFCELWGYKDKEEAIGGSVGDFFVNQEDAVPVLQALDETGRWEGEFLAKKKDGSTFISRGFATVVRNENGEQIGYQSANIDVTAQRQAEESLQAANQQLQASEQQLRANNQQLMASEQTIRESEEKFRALYDNAPLSYQSLNEDGSFKDVNPAWLSTLGYLRDEVIGKFYKDFLHPDWQAHFEKNFPAFKKRGYVNDVHFKIRHKKGHYLDISFNGCIGYNPDGSFKQTYCVFQDITERKQAEEALEKSEKFSKDVIDSMMDGFSILDKDGVHLDVNKSFSKMTGYNKEELIGLGPPHPYWPEEEFENIQKAFEKTAQGLFDDFELVFKKKNGERFPVIVSPSQIKDDKGNVIANYASIKDITETKTAQIKRENIKNKLLEAQEIAGIGSWDYSFEEKCSYWTPEMYKIFGLDENHGPIPWPNHKPLIHPDDWERIDRVVNIAFTKGTNYSEQFRIVHKNGSIVWAETKGNGQTDEKGNVISLSGTVQDITERKQLEKEREQIFNQSFDMICTATMEGYLKDLNPAWEKTLGWTHNELRGKPFIEFIHPEDHATTLEAAGSLQNGIAALGFENRYLAKDGSYKWLSWNTIPVLEKNMMLGIARDITEHKQAEEKLRVSEERFELAMNASSDGLFDWNLETNEIYYSPAWKKMLGYEDHELPNDFSVWETTTAPGDVKKSWEQQEKLISKQIDRFVIEFKMKHKDGHWVDVLSRARAIFDDEGKAIRIVGTHTDITERKQFIKTIQERNEYIESIMENMPIGFALNTIDDGDVKYMNDQFEEIYGWSRNILTNTSIFFEKVFPEPEYREKMKAQIIADMESGDPKRMHWDDLKIVTSLGEVRYVNAFNIPLIDQNLMISTVQDVTNRNKAEEELAKYRENLEELVKERTKELEELNSELERYNSLFEGREFRIKELRDQVKELKAKLGE